MSRSAVIALASSLALGACSGRVAGLGDEQPLLATVRVRLEGSLLALPTRLRVGVLWTGVPAFVPYCHEFGYTPLDPERDVPDTAFYGCRDPFDVVPGVMGPSVPAPVTATVDTFEIPLRQVPPASVMVGEPGRRVAYGSVVVFDDQNDSGDLDFPPRCGGAGGPGSGRADAGARDAGPGDAEASDGGDEPRRVLDERLWGASFDGLLEPHLRVVYREGAFDRGSFFYPPPAGCTAEPPVGFSLWRVDSTLEPEGTCAVVDLAEPVRVALERPASASGGLRCRDSDRSTFPRELNQRTAETALEGGRWVFDCLPDGTVAVVDSQCTCREVRTYPLAGCRDEVNCPVPEWDLRANPPSWWPCPVLR